MNHITGDNTRGFEHLLGELQATVARLERTDLTLEEAVTAYERCVELANACTAILDAAELRVSQVKVEPSRLGEQAATYAADSFAVRRLLLGEDDDLADLLGDDEN